MLTGKIVGVIMQMITGNLSKEAAASFGCIATERKNFAGKECGTDRAAAGEIPVKSGK